MKHSLRISLARLTLGIALISCTTGLVAGLSSSCHDEIFVGIETSSASEPQSFRNFGGAAETNPLFALGSKATAVQLTNGTSVLLFIDYSHGIENMELGALVSSDSGACWTKVVGSRLDLSTLGSAIHLSNVATLDADTFPSTDGESIRLFFTLNTSNTSGMVYSAASSANSGHLLFALESGLRYSAPVSMVSAVTRHQIISDSVGSNRRIMILSGKTSSGTNNNEEDLSSWVAVSTDSGSTFTTQTSSLQSSWEFGSWYGAFTTSSGEVQLIVQESSDIMASSLSILGKGNLGSAAIDPSSNEFLVFNTTVSSRSFIVPPPSVGEIGSDRTQFTNPKVIRLANGTKLLIVAGSTEGQRTTACSRTISYETGKEQEVFGGDTCQAAVDFRLANNNGKSIVSDDQSFFTKQMQLIFVSVVCALCIVFAIAVGVCISKECRVKASDVERERQRVRAETQLADGEDPGLITPGSKCLHTQQYKRWEKAMSIDGRLTSPEKGNDVDPPGSRTPVEIVAHRVDDVTTPTGEESETTNTNRGSGDGMVVKDVDDDLDLEVDDDDGGGRDQINRSGLQPNASSATLGSSSQRPLGSSRNAW